MEAARKRKERLESLLLLARVARGWSRSRLAEALGRDPTKVVPDSGNPKMDYIVALAEVLEWPVGDVVEAICFGGRTGEQTGPRPDESFESLNDRVMNAISIPDHREVVELSKRMYDAAKTAEHRAHACIREAAGWDGLGRYPKVAEAARRGLRETPISMRVRLALQATLANAQYTLWDLTPALGTSEVIVKWYEQHPPQKDYDWKRVAYVHYVRGNTRRRLISVEPENKSLHAELAKADLEKAAQLYRDLAERLSDPNLEAIANTCDGGLTEIEVELDQLAPQAAVDKFLNGLDNVVDLESGLSGDWIESYGWWSIFGSNVALRYLTGRELQQSMAVFTNKALEIAERLDNWAMRERVFTMQYALHQTLMSSTGLDLPYTIDDEEQSLITATMGRFPSFRELGWRILDSAQVVRPS